MSAMPRGRDVSDRRTRNEEAAAARVARHANRHQHLEAVPDLEQADAPKVPLHQRDLPIPDPLPTRQQLVGAARYRMAVAKTQARHSHRHAGQITKWAWKGAGRAGRWWWELATSPDHRNLAKAASKSGDKKGRDGHLSAAHTNTGLAALAAGAAVLPALFLVGLLGRPPGVLACLAVLVAVLAALGRRPDEHLPAAPVAASTLGVTPDRILKAFEASGFPGAMIVGGASIEGKGLYRRLRVVVDLAPDKPHTASKVIAARETIAGRLGRDMPCVHLTRGAHPGQVTVTLLDQDAMAGPPIPSPALTATEWSMWDAPVVGLDPFGNEVRLPLLWTSLLVGAQPRMGKTFAMRLLCLWIALDMHARLYIWDGKGGGDYRWFKPIAARYGQGHSADKGHPAACLKMLREVSRLVADRNERIGQLPTHLIPEGKLTREVACDPKYDLPLIFVVVDEAQRLIPDPDFGQAIRDELIALAQNAPSCGVILIVGAQRPTQTTGKGSLGDLPPAMGSRCAFKTMDAGESNTILGDGYAGNGWDSSEFPPDYEGVSILRSGADVEEGPKGCQLVKWACVDNRQLEAKMQAIDVARGVVVAEPPVKLAKPDARAEARARLLEMFEPDEDRLPLSGLAMRLGVELVEARRLVAEAGGKVTTIRLGDGTPEGVKRASLGVD